MKMYLVTTAFTGYEFIKAVKENGNFKNLDGEVIPKSHIQSLDVVTPDQAEFELTYRKYELHVDFHKHDNLVYGNPKTQAIYSLWRNAKGLPVSDPNYIRVSQELAERSTQQSEIYSTRKYKGD